MKVLFVIPRNKSLFGDMICIPSHPHVGIAYLASYLKSKGIEVSTYDEGLDLKNEHFAETIKGAKPDLIGVTIFSYCYNFAYELIERIQRLTNVPIVVGGPHVSAVRRTVLEETNTDFAIKHEGEITLLELLDTIKQNKKDFSYISGLIWRRSHEILENEDRPFIEDLDSLSFPDYETFNLKKYVCYQKRYLPIITSRGCPYLCGFCSVKLSMGSRFRARSAENVFIEINKLYKEGWHAFEINDDCFNLDMNRAERICDLIIESGIRINFQLYNGIRADRLNLTLLEKMKKAGCSMVAFGCESGSERVLKTIKKGLTKDIIKKAVDMCNKMGIQNSVNFIIGHPTETYKEARESIEFAKSLPTGFVNFCNLVPYPGTDAFEWVKEHGRFLKPVSEYLKSTSYRDDMPVFETADFTQEERTRVLRKGFSLYEKTILKFRLGRFLGTIIYFITRARPIMKWARNFALSNPCGRWLYIKLSESSRTYKINK